MELNWIKTLRLLVVWLFVCAGPLLEAATEISRDRDTHVYEMVEVSFTAAKSYDNPYLDVDLWVDLKGPDQLNYRIPAFWDGGQTWRARLAATAPGDWHWSTGNKTGDPGLDGKTGRFNAIAWTEA